MITKTTHNRIALLGQYGGGNLGDAAIWESLLAGIRRRVPNAEILAFTCKAEDTIDRHNIQAFDLRWRPPAPAPETSIGDSSITTERHERSLARTARRAIAAIPGLRRFWWEARYVGLNELQHRRNERHLQGCDLVVVAGSGQFNSLFGGPLIHPLALWRWGIMSRRAKAAYVILSVGTGTLKPPSRLLIRRALALTQYASFRDARSQELVGGGAAKAAQIVPDLAYGLQLDGDDSAPTRPPAPAVVGVAPMAYADPRFYPIKDLVRYRQHLKSLATLTVRLLRAGHKVVLFVTDAPDNPPRDELKALIDVQINSGERARLSVPAVAQLQDLFSVLRKVDVVISARLHGVLLAHVAGSPALAIAHERKVATLMADMGQSRYCQPIDTFDLELGYQRLLELIERRVELGGDIRNRVRLYRQQVNAQYDLVFGRP